MAGFSLTDVPFIGVKGFINTSQKKVKIRNSLKNILVAHPEECTAIFQSEDDAEVGQATFYLEEYTEVGGDENSIPVAFSCQIDDTNYLLCVASNSVILKETELPEEITTEVSEYIFYKRNSSDEYVTFESSVERGFCLAFSEDAQCLELKPYLEDEFDETKAFLLEYSDEEILKITKKNHPYNFQNILKDLLVAHPDKSAATFDSVGNVEVEKTTFYMNTYSETASNEGMPVAITCKVGNKNYFLCVHGDSVNLKEGELPTNILTETSELIFYAMAFAEGSSTLRFESSSVKGSCIAWNIKDSAKNLILKHYSKDNLDETMKMSLTQRD